jgi:hypothetical protein
VLKILGQEGAEFAVMSGGHSMYSYIFELLPFAGWVLEGEEVRSYEGEKGLVEY